MKPKPIWSAPPDEVRALFLDYFRKRGHEILPSASLVPENDPSLLFIGAGMAPFKDRFLGRVPLTFRRAATSQKCLRTGDLENVGRTPGHHTFFEMLGNFSFGDSATGGYGKEDAIRWAWEFLTSAKWLGIPKERLRVSVYEKDEEAAALWKKITPLRDDRIARLGAKSNFWPANAPEDGPDGPCGPCSEIFFDLGFKPDESIACTVKGCPDAAGSPDCDCQRFLEIWNLVFQQYDRRGKDDLVPLKMQNIDTGMGFERLLTVLAHLAEGKRLGERAIYSNFDTPLFRALMKHGLDGSAYADIHEKGWPEDHVIRARRIADHVRAAVFCVADGVRPSNEGRGYVLRRVIRRAVRDLVNLGYRGDRYLASYVPLVSKAMGSKGAHPELRRHEKDIGRVIDDEEQRFRETYASGEQILLRKFHELFDAGVRTFPGATLFELYDTYGFPADIAIDFLHERGMEPDLAAYELEIEKARTRSRDGSKIATDIFAAGPLERLKREGGETVFLGYGPEPERKDGTYAWDPGVEASSVVAEILVGEKPVDRMEPGQEGAVVLRETPFYAEQGGQVGDAGEIRGPVGAVFRVKETKKVEGFHLHFGTLESAPMERGDQVKAAVDRARRDAVRRNHTATHLLHRVLRSLLGEEAAQAGSLVAPDYLRFDFRFPRALTPEERERVEAEVNRRICENHPVETRVYDAQAARATGAVSMFGEKYGTRVRVLTAGDSREFCGGTHCRATGDIGSFRIQSEKSIGSGIRRIEAVTGERAVREFQEDRRRVQEMAAEVDRLRKEAAKASKRPGPAAPAATVDPLAAPRRRAGPIEFVVLEAEDLPEPALLGAGDRVKADAGSPVAALVASRSAEGVALVAAGNPAAVKAGFRAGAAVKAAAEAVGGGGGGRPDLARGKGKDASRLPEAVAAFERYLAGL